MLDTIRAPREDGTTSKAATRLAVLSIQRTCVHDGPGIRTTVFFRGCTLQCAWCHNPEAQRFARPSERAAFSSVTDIMRAVRKDRAYYRSTHGGVTLSGGEPLMQHQASLVRLLTALTRERIPVAVETAGDAPWRAFEAALPYVDLFLFDLKAVGDDELHRRLTGRPLAPIEKNLRRLIAARANVRIRMCVVPGHNDSPAQLAATARLLHELGQPALELLRYYDLHEAKARQLGLPQAPLHIPAATSAKALTDATRTLTQHGITVTCTALAGERHAAPFTPRVHALQKAIRDSGYHVCLESAQLKTDFYRFHNAGGPVAVQRANLLRYLLNKKQVTVYPDELLVGNFTSKRVGGSVWPEYFGTAIAITLWGIDRQKPVSFECSRADKVRFYRDILPFWASRSLIGKLFPSAPLELAAFLARMAERRVAFQNNMAGIAHFIVNCERVLTLGTTGIAAEVRAARETHGEAASGFYEGVLIALAALESFAERYSAHLTDLARREPDETRRAELDQMAAICAHVPRHPARTFHEALQSILFLEIALCTESFENAISLGRLDRTLQPYFAADVAAKRLDYTAARELMACFILKMDELIFLNDGDRAIQLGKMFESLSPVQTVTVGGVGPDGEDQTSDVTYLILDACELRPIGVNMAARIHAGSPEKYVARIAEVYLNGSPMPALYNDEVYIPALRNRYPTSLPQARNYSIVGCVEPVASDDHFANTDCANINLTMPFLQALTGDTRPLWRRGALDHLDRTVARHLRARWPSLTPAARHKPPASLDELMERFEMRLTELAAAVLSDHQRIEKVLRENLPTPLASSLYKGCIASGKDVYEGGATFNSSGIQAVGVTDVSDSLAALEAVVFRERRYTLAEVITAAEANFEGEHGQAIRAALLAVPKFGDDASERAHDWMNRVMQAYTNALDSVPHTSRQGIYAAGYYGLNVNKEYGKKTPALPSGRHAGVPLANSICPHFGMQHVDLTASLNAVARVDFAQYAPNGTTVTSTIDSGLFPGEDGVANLGGLIRGFFDQGGMQFQPNLISRELLLDAYANPGKHKNLVVRIAGYCGYFDTLSDELKREIIARTYYTETIGARATDTRATARTVSLPPETTAREY